MHYIIVGFLKNFYLDRFINQGAQVFYLRLGYKNKNYFKKQKKTQKLIIIVMKQKMRISIDDNIYKPSLRFQKNYSTFYPKTPVAPLMKKKSSKEILSIHQQSDRNNSFVDKLQSRNDKQIDNKIQPVVHRKGIKPNQRYNTLFDDNTHYVEDLQESQSVEQEMNNAITFNNEFHKAKIGLQNYSNLTSKEKLTQIPYTKSSHQLGQKLLNNPKQRLQVNNFLRSKPNIESIVSRQSFEQVVNDLETHNKNIMKETKRRIEQFESYIEQLLQSNAQMESNLLEYENYIEMLENQKLEILQRQKQRQIILQKTMKQKLIHQQQIKNIKEAKSQSPPTSIQTQSQIKRKQEQNSNLKQQLLKKQQTVSMLEQLVTEKQNTIKKMANFNNQMCLQIMSLKSSRAQSMSNTVQFKKKPSHEDFIYAGSKQNDKNLKKILQTKEQNTNLKKMNRNLQKQVKKIIQEDQIIILYIQKQARHIENLQYKLQYLLKQFKKVSSPQNNINKMQNSIKYSQMSNSIHVQQEKNLKSPYKKLLRQIQSSKDIKQSQSEIVKLDRQFEDQLRLEQRQVNQQQMKLRQKQDEIILKKIDNVLKILCQKLKTNGKKQRYKQTIHSIMRTLTQINDEMTQAEGSSRQAQNLSSHRDRDSNILSDIEQLETKIQNPYNSNSIVDIVQRNQQIFKKIGQIKKKMKIHTVKDSINQFDYVNQACLQLDDMNNQQSKNGFVSKYMNGGKNSTDITRSCDILGSKKLHRRNSSKDYNDSNVYAYATPHTVRT